MSSNWHNTENRGVLLRCDSPKNDRCQACRLGTLAEVCRQLIVDTYAEHHDVLAVDIKIERWLVPGQTSLSAGDYLLFCAIRINGSTTPSGDIDVRNVDNHSLLLLRYSATLAARPN